MNRRSVSLSCLTKEEPPLVSKHHNELNSREAELARWSEDLKRREKALQQKHEIRDQDLLYSGNQNLSPPSFHCLDRYPPKFSCRSSPSSWESIKRTRVDPGGSTRGTASRLLRATDQHDAWPGSRYGDLQEHSAPFVQTPEQPRSSLLRPRVGFHPPCQEVEFDTPAFSGLDRENSQSVRPRFSADNHPNYLSQGPSSSCSDVEKLVGALYTLTNRVNQRPLALSKEKLFDGNPLNYRRFIRHFDAYIARGVVDMADRLNLLISSCTGEAKESIADCILARSPDLGYDEARRILEVNFGQEHAIVSAYVRKLTEGPPIRSNDKSALAQLARDMRNCEISCGGMSSAGLDTQHAVASIFKRLPANRKDKFMASVGPQLERGQPILFSQLSEFLERRSLIEKSFLGQLAYHRKERGFSSSSQPDFGPRRTQKYSVNTAQVGDDDSRGNVAKQGCAFCLGQHAIWRCERFSKQPLRKRRAVVKSENLCFNCLGSHLVRACKSKSTCRECGGRHNTLLHEERQEVLLKENTPPLQERQDVNGAGLSSRVMSVVQNIGSKCNEHPAGPNTSSFAQTKDSTAVRLKVVPVRVWGAGRRRHADVYAFLDEVSDTSLCTEDLIRLLGLKGKPTQFSLSTMSGTEQQSGRQVSLCVQGFNEDAVVNLSNVLSVTRLPDLGASIPSCRDHKIHAEVLKGVTFPDLRGKVELLIGANVPEAHRTLEYRINHSGGPNAVKSPLGWSLIGSTQGAKTANFINLNFVQTDSTFLHEQMQAMYNRDFITKDSNYGDSISVDDRKAIKIMEESIIKKNGRFQVALPWKSSNVSLPNNKQIAMKRLDCLGRKLARDPELHQKYLRKMNEYLEQGHARLIPKTALARGPKTWYLPHHATSGKFRIVFDCAAQCRGASLNDYLLQGPDHTNNLLGVLLRFRAGPVVVLADI